MNIFILVLSVMLMCSSTAFAGDVLYRMLYGDEHQDAIVLFEVVDAGHPKIQAKVLHVISGKVSDEVIAIENKDIRLIGMLPDSELNEGDYCVMSVKKNGNHYKQAWLALKADSGDYKTLKFYYSSHFSDIDALQYYVNSGGVEKDFNFDGVQVFVTTVEGEKKEITLSRTPYLPQETFTDETVNASTERTEESIVHDEIETTEAETSEAPVKRSFSWITLWAVLIVGLIGYGLGRFVRRR